MLGLRHLHFLKTHGNLLRFQGTGHSRAILSNRVSPVSISWSFCLLIASIKMEEDSMAKNTFIISINSLPSPCNFEPLIFNCRIKGLNSHERNFMPQVSNIQGRGGREPLQAPENLAETWGAQNWRCLRDGRDGDQRWWPVSDRSGSVTVLSSCSVSVLGRCIWAAPWRALFCALQGESLGQLVSCTVAPGLFLPPAQNPAGLPRSYLTLRPWDYSVQSFCPFFVLPLSHHHWHSVSFHQMPPTLLPLSP